MSHIVERKCVVCGDSFPSNPEQEDIMKVPKSLREKCYNCAINNLS